MTRRPALQWRPCSASWSARRSPSCGGTPDAGATRFRLRVVVSAHPLYRALACFSPTTETGVITAASEPGTTGAFTEAERRYLRDQPLMRFASASLAGKPDVSPVGFEVDGDTIVSGGFDIARTVRHRNITENPQVTVVVDDLASRDPWSPRGIKIIGTASIEADDRPRFRIRPRVIISWGINDTTPGIPAMERREV